MRSRSEACASPDIFSAILYEQMMRINPGIEDLELYEFRYALDNLYPKVGGWAGVVPDTRDQIERRVNSADFYTAIQIKPWSDGAIVLDSEIVRLTNMLFVGLATEEYPTEWVAERFYFDIRGFYFLHRTVYFTAAVLAHLGGRPFRRFEPKQKSLERAQDVGYKEFKAANAEVDWAFVEAVETLVAAKGAPMALAIAGPTAAGKTEVVERLRSNLEWAGRSVAAIEMDNFLTDRDQREAKGIYTLGKDAIHLALLQQSLAAIGKGLRTVTPQYDSVRGISSHDLEGNLRPGRAPLELAPADIVFIEGNFPFLISEVAGLIGIKVVYLTDDAVRMKRKWKRDIDYRKKYEPTYFRNRFFREQFLMAEACYRPQMERSDLVVDTSGAALWTTPEIAEILSRHNS